MRPRIITTIITLTSSIMLPVGVAAPAHADPSQVFTSSDTFTVPAGVTSLTAVLVGAGGGGGGGEGSADSPFGDDLRAGNGGGGGGAAAIITCQMSVTPGQTVNVTVGNGGSGGGGGPSAPIPPPAGNGGNGTNSAIIDSSAAEPVTMALATGGLFGTGGGPVSGVGAALIGAPGGLGGSSGALCNPNNGPVVAIHEGGDGGSGGVTTNDNAAPGGSGGVVGTPIPTGCPPNTGNGGKGGAGSETFDPGAAGDPGNNGCVKVTW